MIIKTEKGEIEYTESLSKAFGIGKKSVVSIIGAGGKTSLVFALAEEISHSLSVLVTTSTHMYCEKGFVTTGKSEDIIKAADKQRYVCAGILNEKSGKISTLEKAELEKCMDFFDVTIAEADGARHMKIKYPRENEPTPVLNTTDTILVMNISAIGEKLQDVCFNPPKDSGVVTCETVRECIKKYREKCIKFSVFLNGTENEKNKADFLKISEAFDGIKIIGGNILRS